MNFYSTFVGKKGVYLYFRLYGKNIVVQQLKISLIYGCDKIYTEANVRAFYMLN